MDNIINAREKVIANGAPCGKPWSDVVRRAIRTGQWDLGEYVRQAMERKDDDRD